MHSETVSDTNGRVMPSDDAAERALLGAILLEPDKLFEVDLEPGEFYLERHAVIFQAMLALAQANIDLSHITLANYLTEHQKLEWCGGSGYLAQLAASVPTAAFVRSYADLIRRAYLKRQLLDATARIAGSVYDSSDVSTADLKSHAMAFLNAVSEPTKGVVVKLGDALSDFIPTFEEYCSGKRDVWGIPTGLDIDKYIGGLQPGEFWIVAGAAGKGKTSLGLNVAVAVAQHGAVLFCSLEMSIEKLMLRLFAEAGQVSAEDIRRGRITTAQHTRVLEQVDAIARFPIYLTREGQSTDSIRARVAQLQAAGIDLKLVVIDYLRLLRDRGENEILRTANVTRAAKLLARDYNLTVILIHAINRAALRTGESASLQSLAYAGDYDADVVMFTDFADNRAPNDKTASILIAKNRSGRTGKVPMIYLEDQTRWTNPAH